jgi:hypothetical protein
MQNTAIGMYRFMQRFQKLWSSVPSNGIRLFDSLGDGTL